MLAYVKINMLKRCSFGGSLESGWLVTAHLERIWHQHFGICWDLELSDQSLVGQMQELKMRLLKSVVLMPVIAFPNQRCSSEPGKPCPFETFPFATGWLIATHLGLFWFSALEPLKAQQHCRKEEAGAHGQDNTARGQHFCMALSIDSSISRLI